MSKGDKIAHLEQKIKVLEKENEKLLWENRAWQDAFIYKYDYKLSTFADVWEDIRRKKRILEERIGMLDSRIRFQKNLIVFLSILLIAESFYLFAHIV